MTADARSLAEAALREHVAMTGLSPGPDICQRCHVPLPCPTAALAEAYLKLREAAVDCVKNSKPRPRGGMGPTDWTPDHLVEGSTFAKLDDTLHELEESR